MRKYLNPGNKASYYYDDVDGRTNMIINDKIKSNIAESVM